MTQSIWRQERRAVRPKIRSGPINGTMLIASACGAFAYAVYPENSDNVLALSLSGMAVLGGALSLLKAVRLAIKDYRLRRDLAISETKSTDYGSAREATPEERVTAGMDDPRSGELYGLDLQGEPVWRPKGAPFALIEMPPGVGKTVNLVMGSCLHRAKLGYSLIIPDVKNELSVMLSEGLRAQGIETWSVNPARQFLATTGNVELNPYQSLIDATYSKSLWRDAVKIAADYAALHYPLNKEEKNPYFAHGSRRAILVALLYLVLLDPAKCTPTEVYKLLADPAAFLQCCEELQHFETSKPDDLVLKVAKLEARNMLHRAKFNPENFSSFLEGGSQQFISFNPAGHLGGYGSDAIHNLSALRDRQIVLSIQIPLSHLREFGPLVSLITYNVMAVCKAKPNGHPVHIVGEEALNFRLHDLVSDMETMRGLGVSADFYITSFAGLERHYGKEAAAAIASYADVRVFAGLNSFDGARHVADMLAEETVRKQNPSYRTDGVDQLNIASKEMGRRLMTPDEVLAMPRNQAWMFTRNMRPIRLQMLSYAEVSPWRDWVGNSPITGTRLHAPTRLEIDYEQLKATKP